MTYSDAYLDYWGEVYAACRLAEYGVVFERFLEEPWKHLQKFGLQSVPVSMELGFRPLLPRQVEVAQRLWKCWEEEDKTVTSVSQRGVADHLLVRVAPAPIRPVGSFLCSALTQAAIRFTPSPRKSGKRHS